MTEPNLQAYGFRRSIAIVVMVPLTKVVMVPLRIVVMVPLRIVVMVPAIVAEDIAKVKSEAQRIDVKRLIFISPGFERLMWKVR